ncbi:MAG: ATP-binding protein [Candidatus Aenigmatarchaeota archaeon]
MAVPSIEEIREYNIWIKGEKFEVPSFKRNIYNKIKEEIEKRKFIVAIVGMRRIGKTVLMKQIGNELEGEKFFFSFDEEAYQNLESLKFVISTFLKLSKGKPYIFLDEIGRIKGWAGVLKKYHDLNKATFIISSSSYLHITKGKESLAGRLKDFVLYPWSFEEYLKFKGFEIKSVENENLEKAYTLLDSEKYSNEIIEYIKRGGFPEIFDEKDDSEIKKYIKNSTVEKIVFEDLPSIFNIESKDKLYDLLIYLASNSGCIVNYKNIGSVLEISKDTVKKYIFYLEKALLIDSVKIFGSVLKGIRKGKKIYPLSSGITFSYQSSYNESMLVENVVFTKLKSECNEVKFYRDPYKREVDFIADGIPIEVKWKDYIDKDDLKNLIYFMSKFNKKFGIVVSKFFDIKEINSKKIYILPLHFFLLYKFPIKF